MRVSIVHKNSMIYLELQVKLRFLMSREYPCRYMARIQLIVQITAIVYGCLLWYLTGDTREIFYTIFYYSLMFGYEYYDTTLLIFFGCLISTVVLKAGE